MPLVTPVSSRISKKHYIEHEEGKVIDSKKRRTVIIDLTADSTDDERTPPTPKAKMAKTPSQVTRKNSIVERRLRKFRNHPPQTYLEKLHRATTQRMFVISRSRTITENIVEENVNMVGSVGNIYTVTITQEPRCTCPDSLKGNQCKHIIYVLVNVLKAREDLQYQLAFLSSELQEMFDKSPIDIKDKTSSQPGEAESDGKRKPIEGDCPICFMEFDPSTEKIVWCEASCGNNIHKTCFDQWASTTRQNGVRCVYCRAKWLTAADTGKLDMDSLLSSAQYGEDGYLNVASAVGLSGRRDYSTYHLSWMHRRSGRGRRYYH